MVNVKESCCCSTTCLHRVTFGVPVTLVISWPNVGLNLLLQHFQKSMTVLIKLCLSCIIRNVSSEKTNSNFELNLTTLQNWPYVRLMDPLFMKVLTSNHPTSRLKPFEEVCFIAVHWPLGGPKQIPIDSHVKLATFAAELNVVWCKNRFWSL